MGRNASCPTGTTAGTDDVTARGTRRGTDALRCWVQNQNQNQSVLTAVCGVSISNRIRNHGDLARRIGFGVGR